MKLSTMKSTIIAVLAVFLVAVVFVGAGAAVSGPTLSVELEYGDYNSTTGEYNAYIVINGIGSTGIRFDSMALNVTTTNGVTINGITQTDDLQVVPSYNKVSGNTYIFNMYNGDEDIKVSDGTKLVNIAINVSGASTATEAYINITNISRSSKTVKGGLASDFFIQLNNVRYNTSSGSLDGIKLNVFNPHSFDNDSTMTKTLKVEDYFVRDNLSKDIGKIYSELGTEMDLSGLNLSLSIYSDTLSSVHINKTADGNFTAVTGLNASVGSVKALGLLGVWNNARGVIADSRNVAFTVEKKDNLTSTYEDRVLNFSNPGKSYIRGTDINASIIADLTVLNHNIGNATTTGFPREIVKSDLVFTFEKNGKKYYTLNQSSDSGRYNFTITIPDSSNYVKSIINNSSYYTFELSGDVAPVFSNGSNVAEIETSTSLLKIGEVPNMTMTYTVNDYANILLENVTQVKKFYTNITYFDSQSSGVSSMILPNCVAQNSSMNGRFTYDSTTGAFNFTSSANQSVTANGDYVFYLTSDRVLGDVDDDNLASSSDSALICQKLAQEKPAWSTEEIFYGKTTGGAYVPTVLDALRIAKYEIGLLYT